MSFFACLGTPPFSLYFLNLCKFLSNGKYHSWGRKNHKWIIFLQDTIPHYKHNNIYNNIFLRVCQQKCNFLLLILAFFFVFLNIFALDRTQNRYLGKSRKKKTPKETAVFCLSFTLGVLSLKSNFSVYVHRLRGAKEKENIGCVFKRSI